MSRLSARKERGHDTVTRRVTPTLSFRCLELRDELVPVHSFRSSEPLHILLTGTVCAYSALERTGIGCTLYSVVHDSSCGMPTSLTSGGLYLGW